MNQFEPDYRNILDAAQNHRPARLPLYEHIINAEFMNKVKGADFLDPTDESPAYLKTFYERYCSFFREMQYDTVSFEYCITCILPGGGALLYEKAGPIQSREDFEKYPWEKLDTIFRENADFHYRAVIDALPDGMKLIGGVGNGVFEISEDLVGFEHLSYMQIDDPELFRDLYVKIGDLMVTVWSEFLKKYGDAYVCCRFGDDLGYKTGTLLQPDVIKTHIVPQYARIIDLVHSYGKPFLLHSCGCIFDVMEDILAAGIDAKHSNEDVIAPFDRWIDSYGSRIGLFGGIDLDFVCQNDPDTVYKFVYEQAKRFSSKADGYAIGSGNSIPDYVPVEGYKAMVNAVQDFRGTR